MLSWQVSSEGAQDAVLLFLFSILGVTYCQLVEIGSTGNESDKSNVALLERSQWPACRCPWGWRGIRFDEGDENASLGLSAEFVTKENVGSLFHKYGVSEEPDLVSIDIDSCDLWVFLSLTLTHRPRVVAIEYNSRYPITASVTADCLRDPPYRWRMYGKDDCY